LAKTSRFKEKVFEKRKSNFIESSRIKVAGDYATLHGDI